MIYDLGDGIVLHTRDEWAHGRAILGTDHESRTAADIEALVVHRTQGSHLGDTSPSEWIRNLYDFHTRDLGYADIAYELVVDRYGDVWECRPWSLWSAAQRGHNRTSAAVVALSPLDLTAHELDRQHVALARAYLLVSFIAGRKLLQRGHHDLDGTTPCPGPLSTWLHAGGLTTLPTKKRTPISIAMAAEVLDTTMKETPMVAPITPEPRPPAYHELVPADGISPGVVARIRTLVPAVIGVVLTWLQHRYGIVVNLDPAWTAILVVVITGLYYDLVRRLEAWKPELGWLLGYPSPPTYKKAA